jgi:hypothetical protein
MIPPEALADVGGIVAGDALVLPDTLNRARVIDVAPAIAVDPVAPVVIDTRPPAGSLADAVAALEAHDATVAQVTTRIAQLEAMHAENVAGARAAWDAAAAMVADGADATKAHTKARASEDQARTVLQAVESLRARLVAMAIDRERLAYERAHAEGRELAQECDEALARFHVLAPEVAECSRLLQHAFRRRAELADEGKAWRDRCARQGVPFHGIPEPSVPVPSGIAFTEFGARLDHEWGPQWRQWQAERAGNDGGLIARATAAVARFLR